MTAFARRVHRGFAEPAPATARAGRLHQLPPEMSNHLPFRRADHKKGAPRGQRGVRRTLLLPPQDTLYDVADRARAAAFAYHRGARHGLSRSELADWIAGPYAEATNAGTCAARVFGDLEGSGAFDVDHEVHVERAIFRADDALVDLFERLGSHRDVGEESESLLARGLLVPVRDAFGAMGHAPVDAPGASLADRVKSLLLADCLTRPRDYLSMSVCPSCGHAWFDWESTHETPCGPEIAESGIFLRSRTEADAGDQTLVSEGS